jgi:hypothetical protein
MKDPTYLKNFVLILAACLSIVLAVVNPDTEISAMLYGIYTVSLFLLAFSAAVLAPGSGLEDPTFINRILAMLPIMPLCIFTLILFIMHIDNSNSIDSGEIPESFVVIKVINVLFYICALVCIWKYLTYFDEIASTKTKYSTNPEKAKSIVENLQCQSFNLSSFTVFFSTCAGISTMFMYAILKYFSTDGFRGM